MVLQLPAGNTLTATILVVDDSPENLAVLGETLQNSYQVLVANSGKRALQLAMSEPRPDIILVEFRKRRPDAACILISAEPDMKTLEQAINALHVDRFLDISWVSYELKADAIRRSWNMHQLKTAVIQALLARDSLQG